MIQLARFSLASTISRHSRRRTIGMPRTNQVRTVFSSALERRGPRLIYAIRAADSEHMVRNIVGTLIEAARQHRGFERAARGIRPHRPAKGFF